MAVIDTLEQINFNECDSKTDLVSKVDCLKNLRKKYQDVIDKNTQYLNEGYDSGDISGTYAYYEMVKNAIPIAQTYTINGINYSLTEYGKLLTYVTSSKQIHEQRIKDAQQKQKDIDTEISTIQSNPIYKSDVFKKKSINYIIAIVVIILVIGIGIWLYRKYKK